MTRFFALLFLISALQPVANAQQAAVKTEAPAKEQDPPDDNTQADETDTKPAEEKKGEEATEEKKNEEATKKTEDAAAEDDKPATPRKKSQYKPIFAIDITHDFEDPKAAFEESLALIMKNYYSDHITEKALYWAAIRGMLRHVSPPEHPELGAIWTPPQYGKVSNALKGEQVSLGIRSSYNGNDGSLTVNDILPDSPAEGIIQPFDRILRIDGKALKGLPVSEIDGLMNGEVGSSVDLTIVRDIKSFTINLTRSKFKVVNLEAEMLNETIGYARIKSFTAGISDELGKKLQEMKDKGMTKLILDLRNNGGGVFVESMKVAELFLPKSKILLRTLTQGEGLRNYASAATDSIPLSVAILVNKKTASSCEILSAALRDHGIGIVVGTRTYGKGVYEKTFTLKNDYRVKFIVGAMYSPRGQSWQTKGLTPDFAAEVDDNTLKALYRHNPKARLQKDVPMLTAFKLLTDKK